MTAKEYLESKGIYSLDTKKRTCEVLGWMEEFAAHKFNKNVLIALINEAVNESQVLGAEDIADHILNSLNPAYTVGKH